MNNRFPEFRKSIENLIEDEEGNIPGKKLLMLGTMMIVLGNLLSIDAFAAHRSHSSHTSHSSHSSGSHGSSSHGSHESHVSHQSHTSGTSHSSHGSGSTHGSHSSHGSGSTHGSHASGPNAAQIPTVKAPVTSSAGTFKLPNINEQIQIPKGTPTTQLVPTLAVPASSVGTQMELGEIHKPVATEEID